MTRPAPSRYSDVDVDVFESGGLAPGRFLGTVRGLLVAQTVVRIAPDARERAALLLESAEPGLAATVEADEWLLREVEPDVLGVVEPGRRMVLDCDGFWIDRIRKSEDGRVDYAVFVREDLGRYEDGDPRPNLAAEVWPVDSRFDEASPAEVSWPSTSDKRPILALALSKALAFAAETAAKMNEEAGL